jgi:hypothetical protein
MARPRHRADHHAVTAARHPRRVGLNERERRAEIQCAPTPAPLTEVKPRAAAPTDPAAIALSPDRPDHDDDLVLRADLHVLHNRLLQAQQPRPYPCSAHVVFRSSRFQSSRSRNPRRGAACALDQPLTSPTETAEAPEILTLRNLFPAKVRLRPYMLCGKC